jgi:hypothetical protein
VNALQSRPEFKWWDAVVGILGALFIVGAWLGGLVTNVVNVLLVAYIPTALVTRVWAAFNGKLETGFVRRPSASEHRWFLVQALVRWGFLGVWVLVLRSSIVPLQLGDNLKSVWIMLALVFIAVALFPLFPKKRILASRLVFIVTLTLFFGGQLVMAALPVSPSEIITMDMPLRSEMLVFQGGRSPLINHHFILRSQRNALDLVVLKNGKLFEGDEKELASHGCFGQPINAPLSGRVVKVVNDRPDMAYGKMDHEQIVGNQVVLQVAPERFVLFAHLKQGSVVVHEGEHVECGKVLAQCGNSGNTSAPHLHLQVQNRAEFTALDLRTYPIVFRGAVIVRGSDSPDDLTVLRRNDCVQQKGEMCP